MLWSFGDMASGGSVRSTIRACWCPSPIRCRRNLPQLLYVEISHHKTVEKPLLARAAAAGAGALEVVQALLEVGCFGKLLHV